MDKQLLEKICQLQRQGQTIALITVVGTRGSTPRKAGAAMVVEQTGRIWGTIGGGCCEAEVKQQALLAMDESCSRLVEASLLNDVAASEGMVCGGVMEVFIQVL
jgi:xanthine/CO dehydrogenase XdhC/CoxF family maturation factor